MKKKQFCLLLNDEFKEELAYEAKQLGLSLNSYVTMILKRRENIENLLKERNR